jgi:hypothetical protein
MTGGRRFTSSMFPCRRGIYTAVCRVSTSWLADWPARTLAAWDIRATHWDSKRPASPAIGCYLVPQLVDFKNGMRKSSEPRKANTNVTAAIARALTDDEMRAAAAYCGSILFKPWVRVIETDTVPKTRIDGGILFRLDREDTEPLGMRIIETPVDAELTDAKDPPFRVHRVCARGKRREWRDAGHRQDEHHVGLPQLSRCWRERLRPYPAAGRTLTELHRPPALRHSAERAAGNEYRDDEADRGEDDGRGHHEHRRLHGVADAVG